MNRRELISNITSVLRSTNTRKPVRMPKQVFTISDGEGNSKSFEIKNEDKEVIYTVQDVEKFLETYAFVIKESLKRGEKVAIHGFGTLDIHYRKPRRTRDIVTGEEITIEGRYVPKFIPGAELKQCCRTFGMSLEDEINPPEPLLDLEEDEDEEG